MAQSCSETKSTPSSLLQNILEILFCSAVILLALLPSTPAAAADFKFIGMEKNICEIYGPSRAIIFGFGGLSGIVMGVMAMMGSFEWKKVFILMTGLVIVALADLIVRYMGGADLTKCIDSSMDLMDSGPFGAANDFSDFLFRDATPIAYGFAGVGVIGAGVAAMFGKFQWRKFFMLCAGILIISLADLWISYFTGYKTALIDTAP